MIQGSQAAQQQIKAQDMARIQNDQKVVRQSAMNLANNGGYNSESHARELEKSGLIKEAYGVRSLNQKFKSGELKNKITQSKVVGEGLTILQKSALQMQERMKNGKDVSTQWNNVREYINQYGLNKAISIPENASPEAISSILATVSKAGMKLGGWKKGMNPQTRKTGFWRTDQSGNVVWAGGVAPIAKKGISVTTKDGTRINIGGSGPQPVMVNGKPEIIPEKMKVTGPVRNKLQKDIIQMQDNLYSLRQMNKLYKPSFQTVGTKLGMSWGSFKEKFFSKKLAPKEKKELDQFTQYRATSGQLFSLTLKALSGVAVNPTEFKRAEQWIPFSGSGVFDGDSPTQIEAKTKRFIRYNEAAVLRYKYALAQGIKMTRTVQKRVLDKKTGKYTTKTVSELTADGLKLTNNMPLNKNQILDTWGRRIENNIKKSNPNIPIAEVRKLAYEMLKTQTGGK